MCQSIAEIRYVFAHSHCRKLTFADGNKGHSFSLPAIGKLNTVNFGEATGFERRIGQQTAIETLIA